MSFYIVHLLEWFKHYPKEQLLVLRMEDPVLYNLRQAYSFLNLSKYKLYDTIAMAQITVKFVFLSIYSSSWNMYIDRNGL